MMPPDALSIELMASGHVCLNLSEQVSWDRFEEYAEALLSEIKARKLGVIAESVDVKSWAVLIHAQTLSLVFSDYPSMVSLESDCDKAGDVLRRVHEHLASPAKETKDGTLTERSNQQS